MRCSARLAQGFWARSLQELKKKSNSIVTFEALSDHNAPLPLVDFSTQESTKSAKSMCDKDQGGFSTTSLDFVPAAGDDPPHARFHGVISNTLPRNRPDIERSGFAGWRTWDRPGTIFGKAYWNIEMYRYLAMRIKSDGRSYFINLQTENVDPADLHQHRLYARRPGEWETVFVNWSDFVRTHYGLPQEPQTEMNKLQLKTVGMSSTDTVPGPYEVCIASMWATNEPARGSADGQKPDWAGKLASEAAESARKSPAPDKSTI